MSRYTPPPARKPFQQQVDDIYEHHPEKMKDYLAYYRPVDSKGRYLPYHQFRHRVKAGDDAKVAWRFTKESRDLERKFISVMTDTIQSRICSYYMTTSIQKSISFVDRNTTAGQIAHIDSLIGTKNNLEYLIKDLIEDESISSSQLEGAATTTIAAKSMMASGRKPKTDGERMIIGNYKMMMFAWENRTKPLSIDLILQMHECGVSGIDDEAYTPGVFRQTDDICIRDAEGNIVHTPPKAEMLGERLTRICSWINESHDGEEVVEYIHPLIKAMVVHFAIGYEHPFRDGNGRVARCLFYWFMFKNDYEAFRYIAISTILKNAPVRYGVSFLDTENDDMDLTYFMDYQAEVITRAINKFNDAWRETHQNNNEFKEWLFSSGMMSKLSDRQIAILMAAVNRSVPLFTAKTVERLSGCSNNTALKELNGLVDLGLFIKTREERTSVFSLKDTKSILGM